MSDQWTHRTAKVNGINIHYVIHGQGSPVIMLHGWPEFWYTWRKQIPVLAERFQVIVPDMRGFGHSDKPQTGYDSRSVSTDIYELIRHLGHQRVAIVAHDLGVRVSYRLTLNHEDVVERLAYLETTQPTERFGPQPPEAIREYWHRYFQQQFDLPEKLVEGREEIYLRHIFSTWSVNKYMYTDEEIAEYVRVYSQPGALRGCFGYYRALADEDPPQWQADAGRTLSTPLLFLWSNRRARTSELYGTDPLEEWQKIFPNAKGRNLGEYGHFLQAEAAEEVNRELLAFLSE